MSLLARFRRWLHSPIDPQGWGQPDPGAPDLVLWERELDRRGPGRPVSGSRHAVIAREAREHDGLRFDDSPEHD